MKNNNDKTSWENGLLVREIDRTKTNKRLNGTTVTRTIKAKKVTDFTNQKLDQSGTKRKLVVKKDGTVKKDKTKKLSNFRLNNL